VDAAADLPSGFAEEDPAEAEGPAWMVHFLIKTGDVGNKTYPNMGNIACVHICTLLIIEHEGFITKMTWEINRQN
jgi:hypothetical protein